MGLNESIIRFFQHHPDLDSEKKDVLFPLMLMVSQNASFSNTIVFKILGRMQKLPLNYDDKLIILHIIDYLIDNEDFYKYFSEFYILDLLLNYLE